MAGLPVKSWQVVVQDLVRTTRPGGWVELVEGATESEPAGAATERLYELIQRLARTRGLDSTGIVFRSVDSYLSRAGMGDVERRIVQLPVGEWGGRIVSLLATNSRAVFTQLAPAFEARFGIPERECRELITVMQQECEELHTTFSVVIAVGRKPG